MASETASTRRPLWGFLARLIATIVLVGLVLQATPLSETWQALRGLWWQAAAWALFWELVQRVLIIWRWHLLLRPIGLPLPFIHTLRLGLIGLFYNNFMPSTVGGDIAKSYLAIRWGGSPAGVIASVLVDRAVVGWGALVVCGFLLSAFVDMPRYQTAMLILIGGGLLAGLVTIFFAKRQCLKESVADKRLLRQLLYKIANKLSEISQALWQYRRHRAALAGAWLVSCLTIGTMGLALYYWCESLAQPVLFLNALAVAVILKILGVVPISISNVGWSEGATLVLLQAAGVAPSAALAVGLLQRVAGIIISLLGALVQLSGTEAPFSQGRQLACSDIGEDAQAASTKSSTKQNKTASVE